MDANSCFQGLVVMNFFLLSFHPMRGVELHLSENPGVMLDFGLFLHLTDDLFFVTCDLRDEHRLTIPRPTTFHHGDKA